MDYSGLRFSADFIFFLRDAKELTEYHQHVIANALSQSKAFIEMHHNSLSYKKQPAELLAFIPDVDLNLIIKSKICNVTMDFL